MSGLAYIAIRIGLILGGVAVGLISDRMVMKMTRENGGVSEPEMRLPAMFIYACFLPAVLILFGWTADKHFRWIAPIIGLTL